MVIETLRNLFSFIQGNELKGNAEFKATRGSIDWFVVILTLALLLWGLIMVYSASGLDSFTYVKKQALAAGIGLISMAVLARVPTYYFSRYSWHIFAFFSLLLALVLVFGAEANNAKRWLEFGIVRGQPSEFIKYGVIIVLADRINRFGRIINTLKDLVPFIFIFGITSVLIMLEPDFGTTVIIALITLVALVLAGMPFSWLFGSVLTMAPLLALAILTSEYRINRVRYWLNPWLDEQQHGYQTIQAWVALHRGGLFGQGLGNSQAKQRFLPYAHTDFIGAIIGEEIGFLGVLVLIVLFIVLFYRGIKISQNAASHFGALLASMVTILFAIQVLFNLGVLLGVVPPKGLVLPFFSYGASALVSQLCGIGILLSVSAERIQKKD